MESSFKPPWFIDLLNINLDNEDLDVARKRIRLYLETFETVGSRITWNPDFPAG
jgi:malate synthase